MAPSKFQSVKSPNKVKTDSKHSSKMKSSSSVSDKKSFSASPTTELKKSITILRVCINKAETANGSIKKLVVLHAISNVTNGAKEQAAFQGNMEFLKNNPDSKLNLKGMDFFKIK